MIDVLMRRFAEYDYNAEVSMNEFPFVDGKDCVYYTLKCAEWVAVSEWHTYETTKTMMGCKCTLIRNFIVSIHLTVCAMIE